MITAEITNKRITTRTCCFNHN